MERHPRLWIYRAAVIPKSLVYYNQESVDSFILDYAYDVGDIERHLKKKSQREIERLMFKEASKDMVRIPVYSFDKYDEGPPEKIFWE